MARGLLGKTLMQTRQAAARWSPYIERTKHLDGGISWTLTT
jgi:hypothetical protein